MPPTLPADPVESPRARRTLAFRYWGWSLGITTALLLLYRSHPYYVGILGSPDAPLPASRVQFSLLVIYLGYVFVIMSAPFRGDISGSKTLLVADLLESLPGRLRRHWWGPQPAYEESVPITPETRTALLSILVKAYFLPIMLDFFLDHLAGLSQAGHRWATSVGPPTMHMGLDLVFASLFLVDTGIFVYGYAVESERFGTKIRSVEPTLFGWVVALACYPPFNSATSQLLPTDVGHTTLIRNLDVLLAFRLIAVVLYFIYVWASVALGTRASNLTNRGIVSSGPYAYVRHPAYIAKNVAWWFETLPKMTTPIHALSLIGLNLIYFLRAVTEERHLRADPDYVAYCEKVRYRFIPGLF
jgi:protein-S-isoprenylcysteine O-methyltransferase Ste14